MKEFASPQADVFSVREAAKILGVCVQTVKNYIYQGKITSYRTPGGHHRILREDLVDLGCLDDRPSREEMLGKYNELYHGYVSTLGALTSALDARDGISSGHSRRVAYYVAPLTEVMGISREERQNIKIAALLHDVGKVFVNEWILSKPGKLTDQEWYLIRQHPEMGELVVNGVEFLKSTKALIRHHHERFDGKGYPDGLSGEEIPLGARMICVVEAFDCITSECTYQRRRGLDEAVNEIERHAGTQLDPDIIRIFLQEVVSKLRDRDMDQSGETYLFHDGGGTEGI
jgi:excisionase family DNA binding protein